MHRFLILTFVLSLVAPTFAPAQEVAPIPRPRPDRETIGNSEPAAQNAESQSDQNAAAAIEQVFSGPPQGVTLSAKLVDDGPIIPAGVIWRVFEAQPGQDGELPLVMKSENATAGMSLAPGQYVVHVAYGNMQASDTLQVLGEPVAKTMVLDAGALRLNGAITGDLPIPANLLTFDIFPGGRDRDERVPLVADVSPGETIHLNAGIYHVVSHYGSLNAVVRTDIRVDPGLLTDATLYHHAARVSFRLVSEAGGEAIADVEWSVQDSEGETVYTGFTAFPSAILSEGNYVLLAKRGNDVFNREFSVSSGPAQEVELLTRLQ